MNKELMQSRLEIIVNDELTISALKQLADNSINNHYPAIEEDDNNEMLGQKLRAYIQAKDIISDFFKDLEGYKKNFNNNKAFDKAR